MFEINPGHKDGPTDGPTDRHDLLKRCEVASKKKGKRKKNQETKRQRERWKERKIKTKEQKMNKKEGTRDGKKTILRSVKAELERMNGSGRHEIMLTISYESFT